MRSQLSHCSSSALIDNVEVKTSNQLAAPASTKCKENSFNMWIICRSTLIFCCTSYNMTVFVPPAYDLEISPSVLFGVGYILKLLETSFLNESF